MIFASEMFFVLIFLLQSLSSACIAMPFLPSLPYPFLYIWVYIYGLVRRCLHHVMKVHKAHRSKVPCNHKLRSCWWGAIIIALQPHVSPLNAINYVGWWHEFVVFSLSRPLFFPCPINHDHLWYVSELIFCSSCLLFWWLILESPCVCFLNSPFNLFIPRASFNCGINLHT